MEPPEPITDWRSVEDIPDFPFRNFNELQQAVASRRFNLGVDPLAAAEWSDRFNTRLKRALVSGFSLLLVIAALAALAVALSSGRYWLLAAIPIMAASFYFSHPGARFHKWATAAGILCPIVLANMLMNRWHEAAVLTAYAGFAFAVVRLVGYINNQSFRKALSADEDVFLAAWDGRVCTLKEKETKRVYPGSSLNE
jgi:hypothetical protein